MSEKRIAKTEEGEEIEIESCDDCPHLEIKNYNFGSRKICGLKKTDLEFEGIKPDEEYPAFQEWCPFEIAR